MAVFLQMPALAQPALSMGNPYPWPPVPTHWLLGTFPPSLPRSSAGGAAHKLQLASSSLTHPDSMSTCVVCQSPALEADEWDERLDRKNERTEWRAWRGSQLTTIGNSPADPPQRRKHPSFGRVRSMYLLERERN